MGGRLGRLHSKRGQVALLLRLIRTGGRRGQEACLSTQQVGRRTTRSRGGQVRALLRDTGTPDRSRTSDMNMLCFVVDMLCGFINFVYADL